MSVLKPRKSLVSVTQNDEAKGIKIDSRSCHRSCFLQKLPKKDKNKLFISFYDLSSPGKRRVR
jgi:hypothetical protein